MEYKIDGVKDKTALKIIKAIRDKLSTTTVGLFAASTPYFNGMASKRMVLLDMTIPTWMTDPDDVLEEKVIALDGFSSKTWGIIQNGREEFYKLYMKCIDVGITFTSTTAQMDPVNEIIGEYTGMVFMFTGFRDATLASLLKSKGGIIKESLAHKNGVTHLIIPSIGFSNTKVNKALAMDICIISKDTLL